MSRILLAFAMVLALQGCASSRPILYPNEYYNTVGKAAAERDIDKCMELADAAGADSDGDAGEAAVDVGAGAAVGAASGAVGGAVVGAVGSGAAVGAASGATGGLLYWLFSAFEPSPAFENWVNRCLQERGYESLGWD